MNISYFQTLFEQAPIFVLVLFRIAGLISVAPLLSMSSIPLKVKSGLALILTMAVFPLVPTVNWVPGSYVALAVGIGSELLIGISMGFVLSILFVGIQLGAEIVSQQMGLSMSRLVDPNSGVSTTVLSQLYLLLATLLFVLMNGHLVLIQALVRTFKVIPLMGGFDTSNVLTVFVGTMESAFQLAIRLAGPALVAIFLATLALGFISRTMPQLNILAAGFPVRISLAFFMLIASLAVVLALFQDSLNFTLGQIGMMFLP